MATLYFESSFAHHGIKGQKWGVRRYQNPDGTLTKAGKVRRLKTVDLSDIDEWKNVSMSEIDSRRLQDSIIRSGTKLYRNSHTLNESDNDRKYVSISSDDRAFYNDYLYGKYEHEYTATKDLKVAGAWTALNALLSVNDNLQNMPLSTIKDNTKSFLESLAIDPKTSKMIDTIYYTESNRKYYKSLRDKGYDAVIDLMDTYGEIKRDYPLILINYDAYVKTSVAIDDKKRGV